MHRLDLRLAKRKDTTCIYANWNTCGGATQFPHEEQLFAQNADPTKECNAPKTAVSQDWFRCENWDGLCFYTPKYPQEVLLIDGSKGCTKQAGQILNWVCEPKKSSGQE
ncbi:MAG: hypothetical protein L0Y72_23985 [Gemmataceae bacterium]|nr:hypothetical protein [Gemmataceae bacterium]